MNGHDLDCAGMKPGSESLFKPDSEESQCVCSFQTGSLRKFESNFESNFISMKVSFQTSFDRDGISRESREVSGI